MSESVERKFTVRSELGLHARPAGQFVALVGRFGSKVTVRRGEDEWVDGGSVLSLLSLAAGQGTVLWVRAEGANAARAVEALGALTERPRLVTDEEAQQPCN